MVSLTTKTRRRRRLRKNKLGRDQKKARAQEGTPKFPIDPKEAGPDSAEKRSED